MTEVPEHERDLTKWAAHLHLFVKTAPQALAVLFLVECGVLHSTPSSEFLPFEKARHLGHGNVVVFRSKTDDSRDLLLKDGRMWYPTVKRGGLWTFEDYDEHSKLYRFVLTARRNTFGYTGALWHIVSYLDFSMFPEDLDTVDSIPRLAECIAQMPQGYFVPETGSLSLDPPPPMKRVDVKKILEVLPSAPVVVSKCDFPAPTMEVKTETRVISVEVFDATPADLVSNKRISSIMEEPPETTPTGSPTNNGKRKRTPSPTSTEPDLGAPVSIERFQNTFLRHPHISDKLNTISEAIGSSRKYSDIVSRYESGLTALDKANSKKRRLARLNAQKNFMDFLSFIQGDAVQQGLPESGTKFYSMYDPRGPDGDNAPTCASFRESGYKDCSDWTEALHVYHCHLGDLYGEDPNITGLWNSDGERDNDPLAPLTKRRRAPKGPSFLHTPGKPAASEAERMARPVREIFVEYAEKMMSVFPGRRFVMGVVLQGVEITFGYLDHAGSIISSPLNIRYDSIAVTAGILGLSYNNTHRSGVEFSPQDGIPDIVRSSTVYQINLPQISLSIESATEPLVKTRTGALYLAQVTKNYGISPTPPSQVTVELCWERAYSEDDNLYSLAAKNGVSDFPRSIYSSIIGCISNTARFRLIPIPHQLDLRFRVSVLNSTYKHIRTISDPEVLKSTFKCIVNAHHGLYEKAGILHHNISPKMMMVEDDNPSRGVIVDMGSVIRTDDPLHVDVTPSDYTFQSVDRTREEPRVQHLYRHDLESFLYVLIWLVAKENQSYDSPLKQWDNPDLEMSRETKRMVLRLPDSFAINPALKVLQPCIVKLTALFERGYTARDAPPKKNTRRKQKPFDEETLGENVTFETFVACFE